MKRLTFTGASLLYHTAHTLEVHITTILKGKSHKCFNSFSCVSKNSLIDYSGDLHLFKVEWYKKRRLKISWGGPFKMDNMQVRIVWRREHMPHMQSCSKIRFIAIAWLHSLPYSRLGIWLKQQLIKNKSNKQSHKNIYLVLFSNNSGQVLMYCISITIKKATGNTTIRLPTVHLSDCWPEGP